MAFESGSQDHLEPGKPKDERRIVICIDYGTTFTGIAWIHPQAIDDLDLEPVTRWGYPTRVPSAEEKNAFTTPIRMVHTKLELSSHSPRESHDRASDLDTLLMALCPPDVMEPQKMLEEHTPYSLQLEGYDLEKGGGNKRQSYLHEPRRQALRRLTGCLETVLGGTSSLLVHHLHQKHQERLLNPDSKHTIELDSSMPEGLLDPIPPDISTSCFIVAIGLYCISVGRLYYLQPNTKHRDIALVCGSAIGAAIGFSCGVGVQGVIFDFIPGCVWISLVATLLYSRFKLARSGQPETYFKLSKS